MQTLTRGTYKATYFNGSLVLDQKLNVEDEGKTFKIVLLDESIADDKLSQIMIQISRKAQERGLTPEILAEILSNEP